MNYVGIDLGTTNSAICSYDGEIVRLYKSPERHDVTPSAIYIDRRGNKYVGSGAYRSAAWSPDNAATLFKRLMGTSTPINLPAVDLVLTPEECSAEILRVLFGYLPEEIRTNKDAGTVITVPAAFNQMQKNATMSAANSAGIGRVALMQEPVAAVMSVMRQRKSDGIFVIYDIGGGTLDVAIAESISGRVNLLAHGGIAMCGGRDFDRMLFDNIVKPWLLQNFDLPEDLVVNPQYKTLPRMATWATERAKIDLSQKEEVTISLLETDLGIRDQSGEEIYIDINVSRALYDPLIAPKLEESIAATRETLEKAGLSPHDVERIVFVGGPAQYKPLRDKVAFELGISASTEVDPMTAVAEGAAVFAESIDWKSHGRGRKSAKGQINAGTKFDLSFDYIARTPDIRAKVIARVDNEAHADTEFQIDSLDTGWSSGRMALVDGATVELSLSNSGENEFKVFVFDSSGMPLKLEEDRIVISRTAASIDAIPASHSVGVEVQETLGGRTGLFYLVKEGEQLPKKGKKAFKPTVSLQSNSKDSINFKLWEGDIADPINDNLFIGVFKINGSDFDDGVIATGAELICEYEILDSGEIRLGVDVPSIGASFESQSNFYSSQEGKIDYSNQAKRIKEQINQTISRVNEISDKMNDERLDQVRDRLERVASVEANQTDPETAKQAMQDIQEAKRLLAQTRSSHQKEIRQLDLDKMIGFFDATVRPLTRLVESEKFDNLAKTAQRSINDNSNDFEDRFNDLRTLVATIFWRQDGFVIDRFKWMSQEAHLFPNHQEHARLVDEGTAALQADNIDKLREIVWKMDAARIVSIPDDDMLASVNILRS